MQVAGAKPEHDRGPRRTPQWPGRGRGRSLAVFRYASRQIEHLNRQTADAFLAAGRHLEALHEATQRTQQAGAEAAECTGGEGVQAQLEALQGLVDELSAPLQAAEERLEEFVSTLQPLADRLAKARAVVAGFARVPLGLRMVALSARIEAARLPQGLREEAMRGDDIQQHAERIRATLMRIDGHLEAAEAEVQEVCGWLPQAARELGRQREAALGALETVSAGLTRNRERGREAGERIGAESASVARAVNDIVAALQVQDMARQRLEHVQQALAPASAPKARSLRSVCGLQAAHVADCRAALCKEVRHIRASFQEVQRRAASMRTAASGLSARAGPLEEGALNDVRGCVGAALEALRQYQAYNEQAGRALHKARSLAGDSLAGELHPLVQEAEQIARVVRLVSLNASVSTAALGDTGAPLDKLAEALRGVATETVEHRSALESVLSGIRDAAEALPDDSGQPLDVAAAEEQLGGLVDALERSAGEARERLDVMRREGGTIASLVDGALAGFEIEHEADEALARIQSRLEAEAGTGRPSAGAMLNRAARLIGLAAPASAAEASTELNALATNYTSRAERELHERWHAAAGTPDAASGAAVAAPPDAVPDRVQGPEAGRDTGAREDEPAAADAAPPGGPAGDDDLGGNVELF